MASLLDERDASEVLSQFPAVEFAVAYGSGAIAQGGYDYSTQSSSSSSSDSLPMIDFIFAVRDSEEFHLQNLARNAEHYSPLIPFTALGLDTRYSAKLISYANDSRSLGAGYWYNPMVTIPLSKHPGGRSIKYGVVRYDRLLEDLIGWTDLYGAGRLQKPVSIIKGSPDAQLAMVSNRENAVRVALLLLPERFTEVELFCEIAALSYKGDVRLAVGGENPKKILNLVGPNLSAYRLIYSEIIERFRAGSFGMTEIGSSNGVITYEKRGLISRELLLSLPCHLQSKIGGLGSDSNSKLQPSHVRSAISGAIGSIVRRSSVSQSIKGGFSAEIPQAFVFIKSRQ